MLYTSVLVQMSHGLGRTVVPSWASRRAWRRSWLLGFATAVIGRVKEAERKAAEDAGAQVAGSGGWTAALVLASREQVVAGRAKAAYPVTRKTRTTYSGSGYRDGYDKGARADIGGARIGSGVRGSLR